MSIIGVNKWSHRSVEGKLERLGIAYTRRDIGQGITSDCYAIEYGDRIAYVLVDAAIPDDPMQASIICDGRLDDEDAMAVAKLVHDSVVR